MNNSVKAKAAEASLVRTLTSVEVVINSLQCISEGETAEEMAECFHRPLLLQRCVTSTWGLQVLLKEKNHWSILRVHNHIQRGEKKCS